MTDHPAATAAARAAASDFSALLTDVPDATLTSLAAGMRQDPSEVIRDIGLGVKWTISAPNLGLLQLERAFGSARWPSAGAAELVPQLGDEEPWRTIGVGLQGVLDTLGDATTP